MTLSNSVRMIVVVSAAASCCLHAVAATETVLHVFRGATDGFQPQVGVQVDDAGRLYGTTLSGGADNFGIVFRLDPPAMAGAAWTETVLHQFTDSTDGGNPWSAAMPQPDGSVITQVLGGGNASAGLTLRLTPNADGSWSETLVHDFAGTDGAGPIAGLLTDKQGGWYGVASSGGASNCGVVFHLTPEVSVLQYSVLYAFTCGEDGRRPQNTLVADRRGNLYGTTEEAGASNQGVVFRLSPPTTGSATWTQTTLYAFSGGDGSQPTTGVTLMADGSLVGGTFQGGSCRRTK